MRGQGQKSLKSCSSSCLFSSVVDYRWARLDFWFLRAQGVPALYHPWYPAQCLTRKSDPEKHADWIKSMSFPSDVTKGKRNDNILSHSEGWLPFFQRKKMNQESDQNRGNLPRRLWGVPTCTQDVWSHNGSHRQIKKISTRLMGQIRSSERRQ